MLIFRHIATVSVGGIDTDNYLTVEALEDGMTVSFSVNACKYCIDGSGHWVVLPAATATPALSAGQTISFKATGLKVTSTSGIGQFSFSKKCNLTGNCMSMIYGDEAQHQYIIEKPYQFYRLFYGCRIINVSPSFLPATSLYGASFCYREMFKNCTSLKAAPELPAPSLYGVSFCYQEMFKNCTSLKAAPELPATSLYGASGCYMEMFSGCTSLEIASALPATSLQNCGSAYRAMYKGCTSLKIAPELPATSLWGYSYMEMFSGCTSLEVAPLELPTKDFRYSEQCYYRMFQNCSSLKTAPELPAPLLYNRCYYEMYAGCTSLNYIKMLATNISATYALYGWVQGVSSSGKFVKAAGVEIPTGANGIPVGWTVEEVTV